MLPGSVAGVSLDDVAKIGGGSEPDGGGDVVERAVRRLEEFHRLADAMPLEPVHRSHARLLLECLIQASPPTSHVLGHRVDGNRLGVARDEVGFGPLHNFDG